jgi:hypothetical protein
LAVFVLTVLLGRLVVVKMRNYLKELDNQKFALNQQLLQTTSEMNANKEYLEKWNQISGFLEEPLEERQSKFTAYLLSLQAERNFIFTSMSPPTERQLEDNSEFQMLSYIIKFDADLEDLVEFLGQLSYSKRLFRIEKLDIQRNKGYTRFSDMYEPTMPTGNLGVTMEILIPAAKPPAESVVWEDLP